MNIGNNKGFTIVEAIIVTAVLAAVTVMAFPNFVEFFKIQEETQEESAMKLIKQALESYAEDKKVLPATATWAADLAPYSTLSENAIANDTWNRPRLYKKIVGNTVFRSASVDVEYAVVYSHGPEAGEGNTGVDFDLDGVFTNVPEYSALQPAIGDYLIKFTNYQQQIENYKTTETRLKDISDALASYATAKFNEAVVAGIVNAEQYIYYPPSANSGGLSLYGTSVRNEFDAIAGAVNSEISVDGADDVTRGDDMISLMRLLGLPDTHCCEALTVDERPFFYYSNPMPRIGAACGTRPGATDRKLPPRIRVDEDICG